MSDKKYKWKKYKWMELKEGEEYKIRMFPGRKMEYKTHFLEQNRVQCNDPTCKVSKAKDLAVWVKDENGIMK